MPRAHCFILLFVTLCLLFSSPTLAEATVWDETYDTAKIFKAKQDINVRSAPTKGSKTLGVLKKGQTATVPAMERGWYKVTLPDGTTGYIYKRFLEQIPGAQPSAATPKPATTETKVEPKAAVAKPKVTPAIESIAPEPAPAEPVQQKNEKTAPEPIKTVEPEPTESMQPTATEPDPSAPEKAETIQVPAAPKAPASTGVDCVRIKFKNNALTGTAEQSVSKGGHDCYEINLEKSQWMEVWLSSPEDAAMFEIFSPTGNTLCSQEIHWLGRSEQAGEYIIFVSQDSGSGPYNLKVQVK